jgi:HAD superfamily hydrolase (TIGR01509 family)
MAIKAIVFDCFGVLYNDALKDFLARNKQAIDGNEGYYYHLCNQSDAGLISDDDFYRDFAEISGESPQELRAEFHDTRHVNRRLIPVIEQLKTQYKIGMLSNTGAALLEEFLAEHGIRHLFGEIVASSDTGYIKPQREIFEITAQRLGVALDEIYFIDDSPRNVDAAKSYGMGAHLYTTVAELQDALRAQGIG